jgi:hypothetical protein
MNYICLSMQVNDNRIQQQRTSNTNLCAQRKIKCQGAPGSKKEVARHALTRPTSTAPCVLLYTCDTGKRGGAVA